MRGLPAVFVVMVALNSSTVLGDPVSRQVPAERGGIEDDDDSFWTTFNTTEPDDVLQDLGINWNRIVDYVINVARQHLSSHGKDEVPLPDIDRNMGRSIGFVPFQVHFTASQGRVGRMSSLHRVGNVSVTREGPAYRMTCALGLSPLELRYGRYEARVAGRGPHGEIIGRVGENALRLVVQFKVGGNGECTAELQEVRVVQLDGLRVRVTGMGFLNTIVSNIASAQINKRKEHLIQVVEDMLSDEIDEMLQHFRCDEYLSMFLV